MSFDIICDGNDILDDPDDARHDIGKYFREQSYMNIDIVLPTCKKIIRCYLSFIRSTNSSYSSSGKGSTRPANIYL